MRNHREELVFHSVRLRGLLLCQLLTLHVSCSGDPPRDGSLAIKVRKGPYDMPSEVAAQGPQAALDLDRASRRNSLF